MNSTDIMECLSRNYLETIANRTGYFNMVARDYGTDLHISKAVMSNRDNYRRWLTSGRQIHIQVKSVLEHNVTENEHTISYNLERKNYDDLIERRDEPGSLIPLILIVFIFPTDEDEWLSLTADELILRRQAYWYYPDQSLDYTKNATSQVIKIPKSNLIDFKFFPMIFNYFN